MKASRGKPGKKAKAKRRPARPKARSRPKAKVAGKSAPRPAPRTQLPGERLVLKGACHCGAIEYTYETTVAPRRWPVHACQCTFCRGHGARTTADPAGEVQFDFKLPEHLRRYRFGLRTADFLICRECGAYVAAVLMTGRGALATINVNTLREPPREMPLGKLVFHQSESLEERRSRRANSWTPVVGPV